MKSPDKQRICRMSCPWSQTEKRPAGAVSVGTASAGADKGPPGRDCSDSEKTAFDLRAEEGGNIPEG